LVEGALVEESWSCGLVEGALEGLCDGLAEGALEGLCEGFRVGLVEGALEGLWGSKIGPGGGGMGSILFDGDSLGPLLGLVEGIDDGLCDGRRLGLGVEGTGGYREERCQPTKGLQEAKICERTYRWALNRATLAHAISAPGIAPYAVH
ncbi:hypothetical protein THAOC_01886, partial [Thalassiosira oceanica]